MPTSPVRRTGGGHLDSLTARPSSAVSDFQSDATSRPPRAAAGDDR